MNRARPHTLRDALMLLSGAAVLIGVLPGPASQERPPAGVRTAIQLLDKRHSGSRMLYELRIASSELI